MQSISTLFFLEESKFSKEKIENNRYSLAIWPKRDSLNLV